MSSKPQEDWVSFIQNPSRTLDILFWSTLRESEKVRLLEATSQTGNLDKLRWISPCHMFHIAETPELRRLILELFPEPCLYSVISELLEEGPEWKKEMTYPQLLKEVDAFQTDPQRFGLKGSHEISLTEICYRILSVIEDTATKRPTLVKACRAAIDRLTVGIDDPRNIPRRVPRLLNPATVVEQMRSNPQTFMCLYTASAGPRAGRVCGLPVDQTALFFRPDGAMARCTFCHGRRGAFHRFSPGGMAEPFIRLRQVIKDGTHTTYHEWVFHHST